MSKQRFKQSSSGVAIGLGVPGQGTGAKGLDAA